MSSEMHFFGVHLVKTQTVKEPDTRTFSNLDEEKEVVNANGKLAVLLDHQRSVAGLEGREMRISITSPNETPTVRFTWPFGGMPADSSRPMINIKAAAPASEQKSLETIYGKVYCNPLALLLDRQEHSKSDDEPGTV